MLAASACRRTLGSCPARPRPRRVVDGNLTATFLTIHAALPAMLERGRGAIVTMSSSAGRQPGQAAAAFPLGRIGRPADVAAAATFLLSEQASWLTGVTLDVSGGRIIV